MDRGTGRTIGREDIKLSLSTDDMIVNVENPEEPTTVLPKHTKINHMSINERQIIRVNVKTLFILASII
jgi:hypothetical protein